MGIVESIRKYKDLEDKRIHHYVDKHNAILDKINEIDLSAVGSREIARCEYLYSQAQLYASLIAGHCRAQQKYHEAHAEQAQANSYESFREMSFSTTDSQYKSRRAKAEELARASKFEGDYVRWQGIAKAYENSINSLKDMIKSIEKERWGGV